MCLQQRSVACSSSSCVLKMGSRRYYPEWKQVAQQWWWRPVSEGGMLNGLAWDGARSEQPGWEEAGKSPELPVDV